MPSIIFERISAIDEDVLAVELLVSHGSEQAVEGVCRDATEGCAVRATGHRLQVPLLKLNQIFIIQLDEIEEAILSGDL